MKTKDFFINAKEKKIRLFRDKPSCDCFACFNDLKLGIILTTDEDVERLFDEQKKYGIEFTDKEINVGSTFKMTFKKNERLKMLEENKRKLEKLFKIK